MGPDYTTVYRQDPQDPWSGRKFLGFYGSVTLPDDLPLIAFPVGTDAAIAYQITVAGSDPPPTAVPEPMTLVLVATGIAGLFGARRFYRR